MIGFAYPLMKSYLAAVAHQERRESEAGLWGLLHDEVDQCLEVLWTLGGRRILERDPRKRILQGVDFRLAERCWPGVDAQHKPQDTCKKAAKTYFGDVVVHAEDEAVMSGMSSHCCLTPYRNQVRCQDLCQLR